MTARAIFLTHAQVVIDPAVPVPDWSLTPEGRARHARFAHDPALSGVTALFCSAERKAIEGAEAMAGTLGLSPRIRPALGENDRSATGYLPKPEFEAVADRFFAEPDASVRGWERARDAQARIVAAVRAALTHDRPAGDALFVGHGGTAALLRCFLLGCEITRAEDQPGPGGCWFVFPATLDAAPTPWSII
jgi:broad specificity phosphatase PhoE